MKIKYAFLGISRNLIYTFLLVVQLIFVFNVIYQNLYLNNKVSVESKDIKRFFENTKLYSIEMVDLPNRESISKIGNEKIKKTLETVKNSRDYNFIQLTRYALPLQKFIGYEKYKANDYEFKMEDKDFFSAKNYIVDSNFLNKYPIALEKGRLFNSDEFKREYGDTNAIPIIVGNNYKEKYNIGDELTYVRAEKGIHKAIIVGVIKKNQYIPGDLVSVDERYVNLDDYILTTSSLEKDDISLLIDNLFGNYMYFNKNTSKDQVNIYSDTIKKTFEDNLHVKVGLRDLNEYGTAELEIFGKQQSIVFVTASIIIVFVSLTLIISILNSIVERKKEFGVHILNGGTLKDISITIYLEVFLILFIAYILSLPIIFKVNQNFDLSIISILFAILTFLSIIISIIPIIKIYNLSISELIKGDE